MKIGKKSLISFAFGIILMGVLSLGFGSAVFAPFYDIRSFIEQIIKSLTDIFGPILSALFGQEMWTGSLLFERTLVFALLVIIINIILQRVSLFNTADKKTIRWIISLIVPLIGIRFMDYSQFLAIFDQYKFLSIVVSGIIPFGFFFYFIYSSVPSSPLRRLLWAGFIIIYGGLWSTQEGSILNVNVYAWAFWGGVVSLVFDGTIARYFIHARNAQANADYRTLESAKIRKQIAEISDMSTKGHMAKVDADRLITQLNEHLKALNTY